MPGNLTQEVVDDRSTTRSDAVAPSDRPSVSAQASIVTEAMPQHSRRSADGRARLAWLRSHPWITAGVAVVILAGAGTGIYFDVSGSGNSAAAATTTVNTVSTGTIRQSVSATGSLAPAQEESLSFSASGQVTSVKVKVGDTVKKGQALATVESAALASSVAQAKATVASDQARVDDDSGASSTQLAADKAALKAAKNQLASAKSQLAGATMTAPINGAVAEVNIAAGDTVSGSSSSVSGSGGSSSTSTGFGASTSTGTSATDAQILVISVNSWIVNATVDATSVGLIKAGEQAQLTVSGSTSTIYGTISSVGLVSSSTSNTASYPVVIAVTGSPTGLHDGAGVTAGLIYKQVSNTVVISATALHRDSTGEYVEKQVSGKVARTTVQVGIRSGLQVQITSGLVAGDKIIVPQLRIGTVSPTGGTSNRGAGGGSFPGGGTFPGGGSFPGGAGGGFPGGGGFGG